MTYSIVARDPDTGQMGVATHSQAFAVGSSVPWALPGYGVIATQSMGEPMYGELGLDALRAGLTASEALTALRSVDPHPERRQVAMVDGYGNFDVYTGEACVTEAGHRVGERCVALANMVASPAVWEAMVDVCESTPGPLATRLLAALHAAEEAGGDFRGQRSAALLVVRATRTGRPWRDQLVDLRVDDHPSPVEELDRLVAHNANYHRTVEAFELALDGDPAAGLRHLADVPLPDARRDADVALWRAVILGLAGRESEAADLLGALREQAPAFIEAARRFQAVDLLPEAAWLDRLLGRNDAHEG